MAEPTVTIHHLNSYWRAKAGLTPVGPQGLPSYFDLTLAGNSSYSGLGWMDAWCLNPNLPLLGSDSTYSAKVYSSYELNLLRPGLFGTAAQDSAAKNNLDLVNWVLNQNYEANPQFNYGEVQAALWKLLGYGNIVTGGDLTADGSVLLSDVQAIYNAALTHEGFVPDTSQSIGVVLDLGPDKQPLIIEMKAGKLGDYVWHDLNANGAQDSNEGGIAGATVRLVRDHNSDGDFEDANEVLATTTTDAAGYYEFKGLTPGLTYQVQFATPAGFHAASPRQAAGVPAAGDSDGPTSNPVVLAPGEFNATIDSGFYRFAGLGDFVWHDRNANGSQDAGEDGISGAAVHLVRDLTSDGDFDDANEILATTTTDANGYYEFKGLTPGIPYHVRFSMPAGFDTASPRHATGIATSSDSDGLISDVVLLASGAFDGTLDAGFHKHASLGDYVWLDRNANGVQESGEPGIAGATVTLLADVDRDGAIDDVVATQITDANGIYNFDGLMAGREYRVVFNNPDNEGADAYLFSPRHTSGDAATDSDGPVSDVVVLSSGEHNPTVDSGLYRKGSIHVFGFLDCDGDGVLDSHEGAFPSTPGKTIVLLDSQGQVVATQVTNAAGEAWFEGLTPGTYTVTETPVPSGYALTTPACATVIVGSGEEHVYRNGAAMLPAGDQRIEVLNTSLLFGNAPIGIDVEKLVRGRYEVESGGGEGLTPGFWKTHSIYGPAPLAGWPETGYSPTDSYESVFGVNVPGTPTLLQALGMNGGGLDALLRHSTAALLNASNPYVDYAYTKAQVISMTQSAIASGSYEATKNLFEGQNELGADLNTPAPTGVIIETADYDADAPSGPVIPIGGQAIFTYVVTNTGGVALDNVTLRDDRIANLTFVGGDIDGDGKLDPTETWTYTATETVGPNAQYVNIATVTGEAAGYTASDSDAAHYTTSSLSSTIGNRVWHDVDMDGIQDAGESGMAGITVRLRDSSGAIVQTTTTDANGEYLFNVSPGTYSVAFVKPDGYAFTLTDRGTSDAADSDASRDGTTGVFSIAEGQHKLSVDAGLYVNTPKFFVVDSGCNDMYKYNPSGGGIGSFDLRVANTSPTGVAANVDGSKLWVLDSNKYVYVHNADGTSAGQWKASDLGKAPEGIAVHGRDIWIVDSGAKKIFWYDNAASLTSGNIVANKTFTLDKAISAPKGIATDGNYLWVVNDGLVDKVYVFKVGGAVETNPTLTPLGSWTLATANAKPTGLTIDPTGASKSIWVVDSAADQVFEYANARALISGSGPTPTTFKLAAGNTNPQDIADPLAFVENTLAEDAPLSYSELLAGLTSATVGSFAESAMIEPGVLDGGFEAGLEETEAIEPLAGFNLPEIAALAHHPSTVDALIL